MLLHIFGTNELCSTDRDILVNYSDGSVLFSKKKGIPERDPTVQDKYVRIHHVHGQNRAPIDIFKYGSNLWRVNSRGLLLMAKQLIWQVALLFVS